MKKAPMSKSLKALLKNLDEPKPTKRRLSPAQNKALKAYEYAERQEDRYLGSVFVNEHGQRLIEEKRKIAYAACIALGMTHEHGL